jgi:hypothetical protein
MLKELLQATSAHLHLAVGLKWRSTTSKAAQIEMRAWSASLKECELFSQAT